MTTKKHTKINCWEFMACGREPGGSKVHELGICPAALAKSCHGVHGGLNGGRACWAISGTLCDGRIQGTSASKFKNCFKCRFYQAVLKECGDKNSFLSAEEIIAINNPASKGELGAANSAWPLEPFTALIPAHLPAFAADLAAFLTRQGCQVLTAASHLELIDLTAQKRPDLIVLPLEPPAMEEFSTCALLRQMEHGREVPIIFLSQTANPKLASQGFKLGALDVIATADANCWTELYLKVKRLLECKSRLGGLRALLIGKNGPALQTTAACLEQQGITILTASKANQAATQVINQPDIDMVIAEAFTTGIDAKALCQRLRSLPQLNGTPIILLCPEAQRHQLLDLFQAGATDYILTPCPREELLARLLIHIESRQAIRRLSEESRKNTLILDSAGEGIIGIDPNGQITFANQAAGRLLGYLPDDLLGKNLHGLTHHTTVNGQPRSPLDCPLQKCLDNGDLVSVDDDIFWRSDNSTLPVNYLGTPLLGSEGIAGAVVTFRDITSEKRQEAMRQDMERITRHDLKTPLNGIIAIPDLLLADPALSDRQRRCLELVKDAGQRMLKLINESLDIHKMEMKTYDLRPVQVDLMVVVWSILGELRSSLDQKGIATRITIDGKPAKPGTHFPVCGEKLLCYSTLENLIKNAIEASPAAGEVTIHLESGQPLATVTIQNQGVVPEPIQERFFDKYVTHGKVGGTGLGTYSARLMTETQHGTLTMTSDPGQGTRLILRLPTTSCGLLEDGQGGEAHPET